MFVPRIYFSFIRRSILYSPASIQWKLCISIYLVRFPTFFIFSLRVSLSRTPNQPIYCIGCSNFPYLLKKMSSSIFHLIIISFRCAYLVVCSSWHGPQWLLSLFHAMRHSTLSPSEIQLCRKRIIREETKRWTKSKYRQMDTPTHAHRTIKVGDACFRCGRHRVNILAAQPVAEDQLLLPSVPSHHHHTFPI